MAAATRRRERSRVLPEGDVELMNPLHSDATRVPPLVTRPFSFAD